MKRKHSGPGYIDVCCFCNEELTIDRLGQWIHRSTLLGRCPECIAAGYGWACPTFVRYEQLIPRFSRATEIKVTRS